MSLGNLYDELFAYKSKYDEIGELALADAEGSGETQPETTEVSENTTEPDSKPESTTAGTEDLIEPTT